MGYTRLLVERKPPIATVTLNRPDKLNAINLPMMNELEQAYREAEADHDVWTLIVNKDWNTFHTSYRARSDFGRVPMQKEALAANVEQLTFTIEHFDRSTAHFGDVALFEEHEATGDGQQRGDIGGDEVFFDAEADHDRASFAGEDHALRFVFRNHR